MDLHREAHSHRPLERDPRGVDALAAELLVRLAFERGEDLLDGGAGHRKTEHAPSLDDMNDIRRRRTVGRQHRGGVRKRDDHLGDRSLCRNGGRVNGTPASERGAREIARIKPRKRLMRRTRSAIFASTHRGDARCRLVPRHPEPRREPVHRLLGHVPVEPHPPAEVVVRVDEAEDDVASVALSSVPPNPVSAPAPDGPRRCGGQR